MGLDQYAFAIPAMADNTDCDQKLPNDVEPFFVWRKHPNLHGWMEELYKIRGGREKFNCRTIRLKPVDLDRLEKVVRADKLPFTQGFFFGESFPDEMPRDLKFIEEARKKIQEGFDVYYDSWW